MGNLRRKVGLCVHATPPRRCVKVQTGATSVLVARTANGPGGIEISAIRYQLSGRPEKKVAELEVESATKGKDNAEAQRSRRLALKRNPRTSQKAGQYRKSEMTGGMEAS